MVHAAVRVTMKLLPVDKSMFWVPLQVTACGTGSMWQLPYTVAGMVTVPVNVGLAVGDLAFNCVCIADVTPLTYPTSVEVVLAAERFPDPSVTNAREAVRGVPIVPVKLGLFTGALLLNVFQSVEDKQPVVVVLAVAHDSEALLPTRTPFPPVTLRGALPERLPAENPLAFELKVVQSDDDSNPGWEPLAVCTEIETPLPITAPVPPVTDTPVVGEVILPTDPLSLLLNVFQSVLVR